MKRRSLEKERKNEKSAERKEDLVILSEEKGLFGESREM